ncbi:uncharacterized protein METZ01_LOCUS313251 [marine metagenome]|uniref:Uncharacterized protein n=1 Tax=marine metagenome TaxID=408172 RepID=A0A382NJD2_9ZZZZ
MAHQHAQIASIGPALAHIQPIGSTHSAQRPQPHRAIGSMWPHQARSGSLGKATLDHAPQWPSHWSHWASHWPSIGLSIGPIECNTLNQIAQGVGVSLDDDGHRHSDPLDGRGADRTPFAQYDDTQMDTFPLPSILMSEIVCFCGV